MELLSSRFPQEGEDRNKGERKIRLKQGHSILDGGENGLVLMRKKTKSPIQK